MQQDTVPNPISGALPHVRCPQCQQIGTIKVKNATLYNRIDMVVK